MIYTHFPKTSNIPDWKNYFASNSREIYNPKITQWLDEQKEINADDFGLFWNKHVNSNLDYQNHYEYSNDILKKIIEKGTLNDSTLFFATSHRLPSHLLYGQNFKDFFNVYLSKILIPSYQKRGKRSNKTPIYYDIFLNTMGLNVSDIANPIEGTSLIPKHPYVKAAFENFLNNQEDCSEVEHYQFIKNTSFLFDKFPLIKKNLNVFVYNVHEKTSFSELLTHIESFYNKSGNEIGKNMLAPTNLLNVNKKIRMYNELQADLNDNKKTSKLKI